MAADLSSRESRVRNYSDLFPAVFATANGSELIDSAGGSYLDFFAGAGVLNFGHNHPELIAAAQRFLGSSSVLHALDMDTVVRAGFIDAFSTLVIEPRNWTYKVVLPAPTGSDAIEAALKLARRSTGRSGVVAFRGGYHGMTMGALSVSSPRAARRASGVQLTGTTFVDYPIEAAGVARCLADLGEIFEGSHSGADTPACVLLELVQGEGGVNPFPVEWLRAVQDLCTVNDVLLIVDEIQTGVGRTGPFLATDSADVEPDIIVMSKALSGIGLPLSLLLVAPRHDRLLPGEHAGTFRANQLALATATAALGLWHEEKFEDQTLLREFEIETHLRDRLRSCADVGVRGKGMMWGVDVSAVGDAGLGRRVSRVCFENGLLIEAVGSEDSVLKILPPLTISSAQLREGLDILCDVIMDLS